jgi:hypothetical protein
MIDLRTLARFRTHDAHMAELFGGPIDYRIHGGFLLPSPVDKGALRVIASADGGWDHVSVSRKNRCPNWQEMSFVASLFFKPDETAFQLHVPASDHVNNHPYCLHWWRPQEIEIPRPPAIMVGIKEAGTLKSREEAAEVVKTFLASE